MKRRSVAIQLTLLMVITLGVRAVYWHRVGGLYLRDGWPDVDGYLTVSKWIWSAHTIPFPSARGNQITYPLLLSPIFWFSLPVSTYLFWLHSALTLGTVYFIYSSAQRLWNHNLALLSGMVFAFFWRTYVWFTWIYTEVSYYFGVAWFVYSLINLLQRPRRSAWVMLGASTLFIFFIKSESLAIIGVGYLLCAYFEIAKRASSRTAFLTLGSLLLAGVICFSAAFVFSTPFRHRLMKNHCVAYGLWLSTETAANPNGIEQDRAWAEISRKNLTRANSDEQHFVMSQYGLRIIRNHPLDHLKRCWVRLISVLFPAFFYDWPPLMRFLDGCLSIFLVFGSLIAAFLNWNRREVSSVMSIAIGMMLFISMYQSDGDCRFRLPIYLVLSILAPAGWIQLGVLFRITVTNAIGKQAKLEVNSFGKS